VRVVSDGSVWLGSVMAGCWEVVRWSKVAWRSYSRGSYGGTQVCGGGCKSVAASW